LSALAYIPRLQNSRAIQSRTVHNRVVIIGSGPAAHTAAIYAIYLAQAETKPVLYEGMMANGIAAGGQLTTTTTDVEDFPGFAKGNQGSELMEKMQQTYFTRHHSTD
ncbi:hypothetical protein TRICI_006901, partial [Trichomonascus ciferrii]